MHISHIGNCTGEATVSATGGLTPYTYLWSNAQTDSTATGLCAGTYLVTVTENGGCTAVDSVTIVEPPVISLSTSATNAICGASNGSLTVSASGGVSPYTYQWDANTGSQTTAAATGLTPGNYTVTVTDSNGCTMAITDSVGMNNNGLILTGDSTMVLCNGGSSGTATPTATNGTTPYTYQWDANAGNQTTQTATGLAAGSYTVTVTDGIGCTGSITITVIEPPLLQAGISGFTDALCNGQASGTATVTASGGTTPYSYLWPSSNTGSVENNLLAGVYTVTVTDNNGCTDTVTVTISEPT
ncbi:MAG: hypothetical protein ACE5DN_06795, partial [Flavobacteriales bacterium]